MKALEAEYESLFSTKKTRNIFEYYFTCKSYLLKHIQSCGSNAEYVTYLDADIFFFNSIKAYETLIDNQSVAITPHRFSKKLHHLSKFGMFNAGMLTFKNDEIGRECLGWWCNQCTKWCFDEVQNDRFADQKYIEKFSNYFENIKEIKHGGVNVAPWNISDIKLEEKKLFDLHR